MKKLLRICAVIAAAVGAGSGPMLFSLFWLFVSCDGVGTSIKDSGGSLYGGMGNPGGAGGSSGGTGSGGSGFTAGDLFSMANAGDVDAILVFLSGTGENQTADGTFTVELSADDIGLPTGGTVTLTITGNGVDYSESAEASADGKVTFEVARIVVGTTVTVTLTVRDADGSITATGTATRLVTEGGCDFSVTMIDTAPAPTPEPVPVPEGFALVEGNGTVVDLYVCIHEVTQGEYETYCSYGGSSPYYLDGDGDDYPAYYVSWYDALVYCNRRSLSEGLTPYYSIGGNTSPADWSGVVSTDGKYCGPASNSTAWNNVTVDAGANGYRLPTRAEWMQAADDGHTYSGSDTIGNVAWYQENSGNGVDNKTQEVMTKYPNAKGIYDMSGNVYEWCWDASSSKRTCCGGAYSGTAPTCKVSYKISNDPYKRDKRIGFRVVRNAP